MSWTAKTAAYAAWIVRSLELSGPLDELRRRAEAVPKVDLYRARTNISTRSWIVPASGRLELTPQGSYTVDGRPIYSAAYYMNFLGTPGVCLVVKDEGELYEVDEFRGPDPGHPDVKAYFELRIAVDAHDRLKPKTTHESLTGTLDFETQRFTGTVRRMYRVSDENGRLIDESVATREVKEEYERHAGHQAAGIAPVNRFTTLAKVQAAAVEALDGEHVTHDFYRRIVNAAVPATQRARLAARCDGEALEVEVACRLWWFGVAPDAGAAPVFAMLGKVGENDAPLLQPAGTARK